MVLSLGRQYHHGLLGCHRVLKLNWKKRGHIACLQGMGYDDNISQNKLMKETWFQLRWGHSQGVCSPGRFFSVQVCAGRMHQHLPLWSILTYACSYKLTFSSGLARFVETGWRACVELTHITPWLKAMYCIPFLLWLQKALRNGRQTFFFFFLVMATFPDLPWHSLKGTWKGDWRLNSGGGK